MIEKVKEILRETRVVLKGGYAIGYIAAVSRSKLTQQIVEALRPEQTDLREAVKDILHSGFVGQNYKGGSDEHSYQVADQILALWPKVLSDEAMESIWQGAISEYDRTHPKSQNVYERDMSGLRAISQATIDKGGK